jgi:hypothetical protein
VPAAAAALREWITGAEEGDRELDVDVLAFDTLPKSVQIRLAQQEGSGEDAIAASGGVPVTDDELIDTPNGRVHPDFGYVDGPEPEPDYDDGQPSDLQEHHDFAQDDLPDYDSIGECW